MSEHPYDPKPPSHVTSPASTPLSCAATTCCSSSTSPPEKCSSPGSPPPRPVRRCPSSPQPLPTPPRPVRRCPSVSSRSWQPIRRYVRRNLPNRRPQYSQDADQNTSREHVRRALDRDLTTRAPRPNHHLEPAPARTARHRLHRPLQHPPTAPLSRSTTATTHRPPSARRP